MRRHLLNWIFFIAAFYFLQITAEEEISEQPVKAKFCSIANHFNAFPNSRLEAAYNAGRFIGIKHNYAELGLFLPGMYKEHWLTFADARVYRLENCKWAANLGVGARIWVEDKGIFGTNIFYDYLEGDIKDGFHRMGLGLEWLGKCWDFRINGYIPVNERSHSSLHVYSNYIGNYLVTSRDRESCIREGFDAEIGKAIGCWCDFKLYGAIGPYYYHGNHDKNFWGCQARVELFWKSYLSLQIRSSYDNKYHTHLQARMLLSIPLDTIWGCEPFEDICAILFTQPVRRNGIIFTNRCCHYTTNY